MAVVVSGIAILLLWYYGPPGMAGEELWFKVALTTAILLLTAIVYPAKFVSAIAELDREVEQTIRSQTAEIERLNAGAEKLLKITLVSTDQEVMGFRIEQIDPMTPVVGMTSDLKVIVKNMSATKSVHDVKVILTKRRQINPKYGQPHPERPYRELTLHGETNVFSTSIPPSGEAAFDLCRIKETFSPPGTETRYAMLAPDSKGQPLFLTQGAYNLWVKAFGRDVAFDEETYIVSVTPTGFGYQRQADTKQENS